MVLSGYADEYFALDDKTFIVATKDKIRLYNLDQKLLNVKLSIFDLDSESTEKGAYDHYMIKEINEQPGIIRKIISNYFFVIKIKSLMISLKR